MAAIKSTKPCPIDEFLALSDAADFELIDGFLTQRRPTGALADHVAQNIAYELNAFCRRTQAGFVFGSEAVYRCFASPNTARRADVSFVSRMRLVAAEIPSGFLRLPADVAVEVVSPDDLAYEIEEKVSLFLRSGFAEMWVAYPNTRTLYVFLPDQPIQSLRGEQSLIGRGGLSGFSCPVSRFFPV